MDALEHLEEIAKERGWLLLVVYISKTFSWKIEFGPSNKPIIISGACIEDCAGLMLNHIVSVGLKHMAGEKD